MNEKTETLLKTYRPVMAIVVHTSTSDNDCYLESHTINDKGEIMEGRPLLQETIQGIVDVFFDERQNSSSISGIIPENVLQYEMLPGGNYKMVWWQPALVKFMHFSPLLKIKSGFAPVPALIYHVHRKSLSVFALLKDERPSEKTTIARAPFHNVSDNGLVCLGSASVKKPKDRTYQNVMKYWEDLFWLSEFTHLNGASNPTKSDLGTVWRRLVKNKKLKWNQLSELKQSKKKIKSLFE